MQPAGQITTLRCFVILRNYLTELYRLSPPNRLLSIFQIPHVADNSSKPIPQAALRYRRSRTQVDAEKTSFLKAPNGSQH